MNDKKHGHGVYTWCDGRKYDGDWAHGRQHGRGKYVMPDGTVRIGVWEDGKRTHWLDELENSHSHQPTSGIAKANRLL